MAYSEKDYRNPFIEIADFPIIEVPFDKRTVPIITDFSLEKFITKLNQFDPGADILIISNRQNFSSLPGDDIYPPAGIFTDGRVGGSPRIPSGFSLDDITDASYLAWISTERRIQQGFEEYYRKKLNGAASTYFLMSNFSINTVRNLINEAVPQNTVKAVSYKSDYQR